ncbi:MAG: hypothetical protein C4321_04790 [Chloroflexota bacterium]
MIGAGAFIDWDDYAAAVVTADHSSLDQIAQVHWEAIDQIVAIQSLGEVAIWWSVDFRQCADYLKEITAVVHSFLKSQAFATIQRVAEHFDLSLRFIRGVTFGQIEAFRVRGSDQAVATFIATDDDAVSVWVAFQLEGGELFGSFNEEDPFLYMWDDSQIDVRAIGESGLQARFRDDEETFSVSIAADQLRINRHFSVIVVAADQQYAVLFNGESSFNS